MAFTIVDKIRLSYESNCRCAVMVAKKGDLDGACRIFQDAMEDYHILTCACDSRPATIERLLNFQGAIIRLAIENRAR